MGEFGGSELARHAPIAAAPARVAWRRRGIVFDRYFTRVAILPTFVVMLGIFGMPLAFSFYLSFTGYGQGLRQRLIGFKSHALSTRGISPAEACSGVASNSSALVRKYRDGPSCG